MIRREMLASPATDMGSKPPKAKKMMLDFDESDEEG